LAATNSTDTLNTARDDMTAGRPAAALDRVHAVLAAMPEDADALHLAAMALNALGRRAEALAVYARAGGIYPAAEGIACNRAALLRDMGRDGEAAAVYRSLLNVVPHATEALLGLTLSAPPADDDLPDTVLHGLLDRDDLSPDQRAALLYAKANRHHWRGDIQPAFLGYREANAYLRGRNGNYDLDAYTQVIAILQRDFTAEAFGATAHWGSESTVPVFVVGLPRSGKTTLETLMTRHSIIHGAGELRLLQDTAAAIENKMTSAGAARQLHRGTIDFRARAFLAELQRRAPDAARIVDTNANNLMLLGFAALMFRRAPVIYCRRDPLDVGLACYAARFAGTQLYSTDLAHTGRFVRLGRDLWAHWKAVIPNPILEVDFADLSARPADVAARIDDFLGLQTPEPGREPGVHPGGIRFRAADYADYLSPLQMALEMPTEATDGS